MGITRADNLSRACNNRGLAGWHFSNETADKHGAWQPLHKLVFLQTSDAVRQTTGSTCVGGQSPRRALERSPHALFKLRQKAQCVALWACKDGWAGVSEPSPRRIPAVSQPSSPSVSYLK